MSKASTVVWEVVRSEPYEAPHSYGLYLLKEDAERKLKAVEQDTEEWHKYHYTYKIEKRIVQ